MIGSLSLDQQTEFIGSPWILYNWILEHIIQLEWFCMPNSAEKIGLLLGGHERILLFMMMIHISPINILKIIIAKKLMAKKFSPWPWFGTCQCSIRFDVNTKGHAKLQSGLAKPWLDHRGLKFGLGTSEFWGKLSIACYLVQYPKNPYTIYNKHNACYMNTTYVMLHPTLPLK